MKLTAVFERLRRNVTNFDNLNMVTNEHRNPQALGEVINDIRKFLVTMNQAISADPKFAETVVANDPELNSIQVSSDQQLAVRDLVKDFLKDPESIFDSKGILKPLVKNILTSCGAFSAALNELVSSYDYLSDLPRERGDYTGAKNTLKSFSNAMAIIARNYLQTFINIVQGLGSKNSGNPVHVEIPNIFPA